MHRAKNSFEEDLEKTGREGMDRITDSKI